MSEQDLISDWQQRELAETTFDRNVVVIAGAGTGKTTLLVNRLIHLLCKDPDPIPIMRIVALTFTNKAATEMKVRLRDRLTALIRSSADQTRSQDGGAVTLQALRDRYNLSTQDIVTRASSALQDLEKAQIGTLHSFAAHLLRLYPLESGLDPRFQEDDGTRFEEQFGQAWDIWIEQELSRQGMNHSLWRSILKRETIGKVRSFVRTLCSELVDLTALSAQLEGMGLEKPVVDWLNDINTRAQALLDQYDRPKRRKIEEMLASTVKLATLLLAHGRTELASFSDSDREQLNRDPGNSVGGWGKDDFNEARTLIKSAKEISCVDHGFFKQLLSLVTPFVLGIRSSFVASGWLSFDGLLARARTLLRDHPVIRERIKGEYRAVLVDEFQDTDPVQYEIFLAVSERRGQCEPSWQKMSLEAGKLFIVGDPKQSIYAFRRADIEAFDRVVDKIESEGGVVHKLTGNFRSDAAVLEPVNEIFDRLFEGRTHIQPANVPLEASQRSRLSGAATGVRLHVVAPQPDDESFDAEAATRAESEMLARLIKEQALSHASVKPGHIAILFRKLTQADIYLDALRRYGIPYVIEGEKHFYRRQEVIDLINILRVVDNPHDHVALAGILRSPLGGLTDRELYDLRQAGYFNYLHAESLESWPRPCAPQVHRLYQQLAALRHDAAICPLAEAVQLVFDRLPVLELAAASLHGEQAVANLLKIRQTAAALSDRPQLTLSNFVTLMVARLEEQPDEAESPLAEESLEAVHVLTIHKAKGLEFPVVVLPGLHQGAGRERSLPSVVHDWSSGQYGLTLGDRRTFGAILVRQKMTIREEAERRRVLYVGMTRAKDLLLLSASVTGRSASESVLALLQAIGEGEIGAAATEALTVGRAAIPHTVITAPERQRGVRLRTDSTQMSDLDVKSLATLWQARMARWIECCSTASHLTPTSLGSLQSPDIDIPPQTGQDRDVSRLIGVLAHRILERWEFGADPAQIIENIRGSVPEWLGKDDQSLAQTVVESLLEIFDSFIRSEPYHRIKVSTILGREVPFLISWDGNRVMQGVIDLIYRLDGSIWIADYKTDLVTEVEAWPRAKQYAKQATIYREAVTRCLGLSQVSFQFFFLRPGIAVTL